MVISNGVINLVADKRLAFAEIFRVLRPGGRAGVMVYHRSFWIYYVMAGFFRGIPGRVRTF